MGKTIFDKIWDEHVITSHESGDALLYIDRHLIHDLHFRAFDELTRNGRTLREPDKLFGMSDHSVPTNARSIDDVPRGEMHEAIVTLHDAASELKFDHFALSDERRGIVHVVGPEQGITLPGITLVCGDSHTSTHGALGCIAFGIGSTEIQHVLATQALWQRRPKTMRVSIDGELGFGVSAKDVVLTMIRQISAAGGAGFAIEYAGSVIQNMDMAGRMTICNMTIEAGARFGVIAPDQTTIDYIQGRPYAPGGERWDEAVRYWRTLASDDDARFDAEVTIDGSAIAPMVTWGNSPQWAVPVTDVLPDPVSEGNSALRDDMIAAFDYMDLTPGMRATDIAIDTVFIGSCTNSRIEDIRAAADVVRGRETKTNALIVPGSGLVKQQAENEGLDKVFLDAGMQWGEPSCSLCVATNGDMLKPGERSASTSNRNFRGRQGKGSRTHLLSPAMAAAAAVTGFITDVRDLAPVNGDVQ